MGRNKDNVLINYILRKNDIFSSDHTQLKNS